MSTRKWLTKSQKEMISRMYSSGSPPREIREKYLEKYGYNLSAACVQKYKNFPFDKSKPLEPETIKPELEENPKENPKDNKKYVEKTYVDRGFEEIEKKIKSLKESTTHRIESLYDFLELQDESDKLKLFKDKSKKHIVDFSGGEISQLDLKKVVAIRGTDEKETFEFLKKCYKKGLFMINLETQEINGVELEKEDKEIM